MKMKKVGKKLTVRIIHDLLERIQFDGIVHIGEYTIEVLKDKETFYLKIQHNETV